MRQDACLRSRFSTRLVPFLLVPMLAVVAALAAACGGSDELILATTTSTENSGLLDELVPAFEEETGITVNVIAVGSGAAIAMGESGDADVLLVHSPAAEQAFMDAGYGVQRSRVMHNDFVVVGPPDDPAGIGGTADAAAAMAAIAEAEAAFVSRGDDSGTHAKERSLWEAAGLDVPSGAGWYTETGQGMGQTLTVAAETGAYTLTDRGTWLAAADQERLPLLVEGDERLFNVYHVIVVNPDQHPDINDEAARRFHDFLLAAETQQAIGEFGRERFGQALFTPDALGARR